MAGITAAFGSAVIALIVFAHIGLLTAVIAPLVVWRRHMRRTPTTSKTTVNGSSP
jgi:hypothetical protein